MAPGHAQVHHITVTQANRIARAKQVKTASGRIWTPETVQVRGATATGGSATQKVQLAKTCVSWWPNEGVKSRCHVYAPFLGP